jgi:hypothetical protein
MPFSPGLLALGSTPTFEFPLSDATGASPGAECSFAAGALEAPRPFPVHKFSKAIDETEGLNVPSASCLLNLTEAALD